MKPIFKNTLVSFLSGRTCEYVGRMLYGYGVPIFMLHRMRDGNTANQLKSAISAEHLRKCLNYLSNKKYIFLSLHELILLLKNKQSPPKKSVVFTMDDGFEDQLAIATPIFQEFNCPVTIFLITGMLDNKLWPWDDKVSHLINASTCEYIEVSIGDVNYHLPIQSEADKKRARETIQNAIKVISVDDLDGALTRLESATKISIPEAPPPECKPATWDLVRKHYNKGLVDFAPHTISHRILSKMDTETMKSEILGSWQRISEELSAPPRIFCYPTGRYIDFGSREVKLLRESGFVGAVSTIPAQVREELVNDYYVYGLPRYSLPKSFNDFQMYCNWVELSKERHLRYWPQ